jgi:hypothetical protein
MKVNLTTMRGLLLLLLGMLCLAAHAAEENPTPETGEVWSTCINQWRRKILPPEVTALQGLLCSGVASAGNHGIRQMSQHLKTR